MSTFFLLYTDASFNGDKILEVQRNLFQYRISFLKFSLQKHNQNIVFVLLSFKCESSELKFKMQLIKFLKDITVIMAADQDCNQTETLLSTILT